ncbi:MAG: SPASM domain-containing protein, partial [Desulfobacteraceae bacterium]
GDTRRISVRNFESLLARLVLGEAAECRMASRCDQYLVVEHNGDIYPCDFFVTRESRLGNIHEISFEAIRKSDDYQRFARDKADHHSRCEGCDYFHLCMGDCRKFRGKTQGSREMSVLCPGWRHFYRTTLERFHELASTISKKSNP